MAAIDRAQAQITPAATYSLASRQNRSLFWYRGQIGPDFNPLTREACPPFERGIEVWHLDHEETAELLLRVCVWTALPLSLAVAHPQGRRRLRWLQAGPCHNYPGVFECLHIGQKACPELLPLLGVGTGRKIGRTLV